LDQFIRSHVKAMQAQAARPPKPMTCMRVERVAARSIAAHAGVAKGDHLVFLDGSPASKANPKLYTHKANKRLYTFYSHARSEQVELACTGIEIGVELALTDEAIKVRYKPAEPEMNSLVELWENRAHPLLLELSRATLENLRWTESPALLFEGVGLWEAGQHQDGMALIQAYLHKHGQKWTMNFAAIAMHYNGMDLLRRGQRDEALTLLTKAFEYNALERTADEIAKLTGERPPMHVAKWAGQPWPARYRLSAAEGPAGQTSLSDTLAEMSDGSMLVVCLLATYRSNGPYSDFLQRWMNYATWFGPYVHGLHVITMATERHKNHDWIYTLEDTLRTVDRPFALLADPEGEAHMPLEPDRSPMIFALDRRGTIVYEGDLDPIDLWDTIAALSG
jgi:hypothetical protein